ncbi:ribonuclease P protein component [Rhodobacterales bacterium HKCCE3408]|nr:ribonuclease P protein component [Rhodobacterales bacterium HKCCE3408]
MTPSLPLPTDASPGAVCVETLKKRADFLAAARARRAPMPGFLLQGRDRADGGGVRVGFTCSKKVGNAVTRNRAKRRLRALAREVMPQHGRPGWDYVLIGRADATVSHPFDAMRSDLIRALDKVHK